MSDLMSLRPSRVLRVLRSGGVATCVKLNLADSRVAEIAALAGFDCVWLDQEHVPSTIRDIEHATLAAKAHDCDTLVRVSRGSYSELIRPLELDAAGVMVPHVKTAQEAKQIVEQTRFYPIGMRALDGGNADGAYAAVPTARYIEHANRERFVVVQIEDPQAMEQLDDIAATPGIDMLFFGPGDFSQGLGIPGQLDDPRIEQARREVAEAAKRHGKFAGTVSGPDRIAAMIDLGYRFISSGADVTALGDAFRQTLTRFAAAKPHPQANSDNHAKAPHTAPRVY